MAKRLPAPAGDEWLTLEQASRRLGVHATTLRRWADRRVIDVFLTPGGHRRFRRSDLDRFEQERARACRPAPPGHEWVERTISRTRRDLPSQRWAAGYDEAERQAKRELGRRLTGLTLQYIARPDPADDLLAEARAIGRRHASDGLQHGQSLAELLRAVSFFRRTLLEVSILERPLTGEASARLLQRIEELLGEVQTGIVERYLAQVQDTDSTMEA